MVIVGNFYFLLIFRTSVKYRTALMSTTLQLTIFHSYVVADILSQTVIKPLTAGSGFNHSFYLELLERQYY